MKYIIGVTGASGAIYAVRLVELLAAGKAELNLVATRWAKETLAVETGRPLADLKSLCSCYYEADNLDAPLSSGSFLHEGMVVIPCSMKTLAGIANGFSDNLLLRAADVTIKEKRKLILVPRETPLSVIHLENMLKLARLGVIILPPMPAFYIRPQTIADLVDHTVARVMDHLGLEHELSLRWQGGYATFKE